MAAAWRAFVSRFDLRVDEGLDKSASIFLTSFSATTISLSMLSNSICSEANFSLATWEQPKGHLLTNAHL